MNQNQNGKKNNLMSRLLFLGLVGLVGVFFVFGVCRLQNLTGSIINFVTLIIMFGLVLYGINGFWKNKANLRSLWWLEEDFEGVVKEFENSEDSVWNILGKLQSDEKQFKTVMFQKAVKDLLEEYHSIKKDQQQELTETICDVESFINEDLLDDVGNVAYSEFVSSALTGLGILGTFVGLAISLQSFDTGSAEAINNSIPPLIDGIKIAFYTSIFGVALSLVYGLLLRNTMENAQRSLKQFLTVFHKCAGTRADNEAMAQLLSYQKKQTDNMAKFAETISVKLGEALDKTLAPALTALPNQIAAELQTSIVPSMNALEQSMEKSVGTLVESVVQSQSTSVDKMVNNFIEEMNRMLGGQMENLGNSIGVLCGWQKETMAQLEVVIDNVRENATNLTTINKSLEDSLSHFDEYVVRLDAAQASSDERVLTTMEMMEKVVVAFETLRIRFDDILTQSGEVFAAATETSGTIQKQYVLAQDVVEKQQDWLKANMQTSKEQMQQAAEMHQLQIATIKETSETVTRDLKESSVAMAESLKELSTDVVGKVQSLSTNVTGELKQASTDVVDEVKSLSVNMTSDLKALSTDVVGGVESLSTNVTSDLKQMSTNVVGEMKSLSADMAGELKGASADMSQVTKMLSEELDASMRNTYAQFDKELALAVQHFSGTLTNMKTVLAELEQIVENTPKLLESAATNTQQQMDTYLKDSAQMQVRFIDDVDKAIQSMSENLKQIQAVPKEADVDASVQNHAEEVVL